MDPSALRARDLFRPRFRKWRLLALFGLVVASLSLSSCSSWNGSGPTTGQTRTPTMGFAGSPGTAILSPNSHRLSHSTQLAFKIVSLHILHESGSSWELR
jgi:hypothetical protein